MVERLARLRQLEAALDRSPNELDIVVSPAQAVPHRDTMARYAEAGVDELVVFLMADDLESYAREADQLAEQLVSAAERL